MRKLMLSTLAIASLAAGAVFAQSGDADSQAGSAWRAPNSPIQLPPAYDNSGATAPRPEVYDYRDYRYSPYAYRDVRPAYPYVRPHRRDRDRDGDGIPDRRDRYPDNPYRY
jgi:hypothetical protein